MSHSPDAWCGHASVRSMMADCLQAFSARLRSGATGGQSAPRCGCSGGLGRMDRGQHAAAPRLPWYARLPAPLFSARCLFLTNISLRLAQRCRNLHNNSCLPQGLRPSPWIKHITRGLGHDQYRCDSDCDCTGSGVGFINPNAVGSRWSTPAAAANDDCCIEKPGGRPVDQTTGQHE
jgi:hypothetical protein